MIESSSESQSNLDVIVEPSGKVVNATGTFKENALSEQDAIASGNVLPDLTDARRPTFLDEAGPSLDVPLFITKTNARELFGLRPGESIAQALARQAKEA
ncbi:hypothetical protein [Burkholderia gladioli]|uniref:hypothetical protein n=1 Tax=Burkholderia gladioli TaxID=28095 RepID=UPI0021591D8B|nr:hypothetical protein [Burkholderia gladioli]